MRIANLILTKQFDGSLPGVWSQTEYFLNQGHDVLLTYVKGTPTDEYFSNLSAGKPVTLSSIKHTGGILGLIDRIKLRRILRDWQPDVIICHNYFAFCLAVAKGIAPLTARYRNDNIKYAARFSGVFSVRQDLMARIDREQRPPRLAYIPHMIPLMETPQRTEQFSSPVKIGAFGRFKDYKGFRDFIDTCAELKRRNVPFQAIIGGAGEEETLLQQATREYQLEEHVTFVGWVKDQSRFFEQIDIFCLPSRVETFGRVVLEAFLHGVPIVSTQTSGPSETVTSGQDGLLVPIQDASAMADAIEHWVANPQQAIACGKQGRETVKNYSFEVLGEKLETFLNEVVLDYQKAN